MLNKTNEAIAQMLWETIKHPMSYFSEKALQLRLSAKLLKDTDFSDPIETAIGLRYEKEVTKLGIKTDKPMPMFAVPPLQMEYGVTLDISQDEGKNKPYRLDIAVLCPHDIQEIDSWNFQKKGKYTTPYIGIEIGTEKSGWKSMTKHIFNDIHKLSTTKHPYIINIMRNNNVAPKNSKTWKNKENQIDIFRKVMEKVAKIHSGYTFIGLINHIAYQEVEIFTKDNCWERFSVVNDKAKIKDAIVQKLGVPGLKLIG